MKTKYIVLGLFALMLVAGAIAGAINEITGTAKLNVDTEEWAKIAPDSKAAEAKISEYAQTGYNLDVTSKKEAIRKELMIEAERISGFETDADIQKAIDQLKLIGTHTPSGISKIIPK